jgi:hypothetical protein
MAILSNTQHNTTHILPSDIILSSSGCEVLLRFAFASLFSIPHTLHLNSPFCIWSGLVCSGLAYITELKGEERIVLLTCLHLVLLHGER